MAEVTATRVRFRDVKPIEAPAALEELTGPTTGEVVLPLRVRWAPGARTYDVGDETEAQIAYQAVLAEGTADDQKRFLNRDRIVALWPTLNLDQRVVALWEGRFPELRGLAW